MAVEHNFRALDLILVREKTVNINDAVVKVGRYSVALDQVPFDKITKEVCLPVIKQNRRAFIPVPELNLTQVICSVAVQKSGKTPEKLQLTEFTKYVFLAAVKRDDLPGLLETS